jgi:hypothetical protein
MMQVSLTNDGPVTFWLRVPPAGTPDIAVEIEAKEIPMKLWSKAFADNAPIPGEFAFCVPDAASHVRCRATATRTCIGTTCRRPPARSC